VGGGRNENEICDKAITTENEKIKRAIRGWCR
jgi:hypothetical protein